MTNHPNRSKRDRLPWFKLPPEDEQYLNRLIEHYGVSPILAVLSRLQMPIDRKAKANEVAGLL